jgi:hypothetical protein
MIVPRGHANGGRTMLIAIGKGIEIEVDLARFNKEVDEFIKRNGLYNLLKDSHVHNFLGRHRAIIGICRLYIPADDKRQAHDTPP